MTSKLTRERIEQYANDPRMCNINDEIRELARMALAAMDSEPVAEVVSIYGDPEAFGEREIRPLVGIQQMPYGTKLYRHAQPAPEAEREPIAWLNDAYLARGVVDGEAGSEDAGPGYIPVYREASPVVQDARAITQYFDTIALETAREIMCDVNRRGDFLGGDTQLLSRIQCRIDNACRAAMLQASSYPGVPNERAAFNAWNNEDNLPIAGVGAKNAAWLAWQARAMLQAQSVCTCPSGDGSLRWPCPAHPGNPPAHSGLRPEQSSIAPAQDGNSPVIPDDARDALTKALAAMEFMGDTLNNLDAVCTEDAEFVATAFEAVRRVLAAAPQEVNHG